MQNVIDVYISKLNKNLKEFFPDFLKEELKTITNKKVIEQKTTAYSLLNFGAYNSYNLELTPSDITRENQGKPVCKYFEFSISHSNDLVVVALSKNKVGVDMELMKENRDIEVIKNKYFLEKEKEENFYKVWTEKESAFKFLNKKGLHLKDIDVSKYNYKTYEILSDEKNYLLCVCSKKLDVVNIINLSEIKVY